VSQGSQAKTSKANIVHGMPDVTAADMYPPPHMTCMYPPPHMTAADMSVMSTAANMSVVSSTLQQERLRYAVCCNSRALLTK